jgi:hypothetical protein
MNRRCLFVLAAVLYFSGSFALHPLFASQAQPSSAPTIVRLDGTLVTAEGQPRTGPVALVISIYADHTDTIPLWVEEHTVALDSAGRYAVLVGSTLPDGIPRELFLSTTASATGRWLGVAPQGEAEQPRVMILSVPFAVKAGDAETLAGKPPSDFVLSQQLTETVHTQLVSHGVLPESGEGGPGIQVSTTGRIAKFSDTTNTTVDSIITESGNNIGISTSSPGSPLHVNASTAGMAGYTARIVDSNATVGASLLLGATVLGTNFKYKALFVDSGGLQFGTVPDALNAAPTTQMTLNMAGNLGIGTPGPASPLHVNAATIGTNYTARLIDGNSSTGASVIIGATVLGANAKYKALFVDSNGLNFGTVPDTLNTTPTSQMVISTAGNVGIGIALPTDRLHVNGNVTVTGNIGAKYQDVAEWVESVEPIEAGTVVIVDPLESNRVVAATAAYDTRVAGAVSRQPGLILGEHGDTKSLIAQSGRVRIKVDARYGAIKLGDLLVTSPTPGHAMLSKPMKVGGRRLIHRPGTLLGKALEPLAAGQGEILVLLTLQ